MMADNTRREPDIRAMARRVAEYVARECDGVDEGFEILDGGCMVFVDYRCSGGVEVVRIADVWDDEGTRRPDLAEALQMTLND